MNDAERQLKEFLGQMADLRSGIGCPEGFTYSSPEQLVLRHGRFFAPRSEPGYRRGAPKACFHNCLELARAHPELTYVEGYALARVLPVHHAWLIDEQGLLVEATWPLEEWGLDGVAYLGIPLPTQMVIDHHRDRSWLSVLDNFEHQHPLLQNELSDLIAPYEHAAVAA